MYWFVASENLASVLKKPRQQQQQQQNMQPTKSHGIKLSHRASRESLLLSMRKPREILYSTLDLASRIEHANLPTVVTVKSGACEQLKSSSSIASSSSISLADESLFFLAWGDSSGISWSPSSSPSLSDCNLLFRAISYSSSNINKNLGFLWYKHYKNLPVQNIDLSGKTNTFLWTKYKLKCNVKTQIKITRAIIASSKWRQSLWRSCDHKERCLMGNTL